ncbi:Uncharacterised protein [Vibrio cholerae]|uniref:Uncharacterized protein n=1 Tax=Vibrio cholerae TaxID=666 RepID=A0A655YWK2_VIBCL|nr:Uncharacterised protein [Vibrio cholerae]CSC52595.1 Uncharacterised protein [Vibrio cholerae]CSC86980.1 Uncharacterised protein [Vibrio cholerae]CSD10601.1 Uncharacterised protein [Vibrio cholerae]CSD88665.1 Uncharacterised protein [Vibrio cholerae]
MQKCGRGFFTHPRYARNVIHFITHQGEVVDNKLWRDTEFFNHTFAIQHDVGHGIDQGNIIIHQLRHIFIAGTDQNRHTSL